MIRWLILVALSIPTLAHGVSPDSVGKVYRSAYDKMPTAEKYAAKSTASQDHFRTAVVLLRATERAVAQKDYKAAYALAKQADAYARFEGKVLSMKTLSKKYEKYVPAAAKGVPAGQYLLQGKWKAYVSPDSIGFHRQRPIGNGLH